jgi:hypothetical protein
VPYTDPRGGTRYPDRLYPCSRRPWGDTPGARGRPRGGPVRYVPESGQFSAHFVCTPSRHLDLGLHLIQCFCIPRITPQGESTRVSQMAAFAGGILGGIIVAVLAFITTRYTLLYSYDQTLRDRRLERYQELFRLTRLFHRYYLVGEEPTRKDLEDFRRDSDAWYFGEAAGGMFLTKAAKEIYMQMMNIIAEAAFENGKSRENTPLTPAELKSLRQVASTLRHQLAADVGAAHPPRLRWTRPEPVPEVPLSVEWSGGASPSQVPEGSVGS